MESQKTTKNRRQPEVKHKKPSINLHFVSPTHTKWSRSSPTSEAQQAYARTLDMMKTGACLRVGLNADKKIIEQIKRLLKN